MLRYSFERGDLADNIEGAVRAALAAGHRTADIAQRGAPRIGTKAMGDAVVEALSRKR
jgi:3-isopropylmalate dehydrogenase